MRSTIEGDTQGWGAQLSVIGRQTMVTDTAHGYGVYTGGVSVTVTIIICQTSITSRPYIDVTFTTTSLKKYTMLYYCESLFHWHQEENYEWSNFTTIWSNNCYFFSLPKAPIRYIAQNTYLWNKHLTRVKLFSFLTGIKGSFETGRSRTPG